MRFLNASLISVMALGMAASPAIAASTGTVDASMTTGYSCDITYPSTSTLTPSGNTASVNTAVPYAQNGDTTYTLSALTITKPSAATIGATIQWRDAGSSLIVVNGSTSAAASGDKLGISAGDGEVRFSMQETNESTFVSGSYLIASTLSCAQKVG
jgi:hypothetical protein